MLEKTMKQILVRKLNNWIDSIEDDNVRTSVRKDVIVTGGCFTSFLQNEKPNDYDVYFRTKETVLKVAQYYADRWNQTHGVTENSIGYDTKVMVLDCDDPSKEVLEYYKVQDREKSEAVMISNPLDTGRVKMIYPSDGVIGDPEEARASEELGLSAEEVLEELDEHKAEEVINKEKKPYHPVFISSNAITLSDKIQIVVRFYGEPEQIHDTFDFIHTKAYFDLSGIGLVIPKEVYECVTNKTLKYTGSKYPVCSIFRIRKFIKRGWHINAGQLLKMCLQISKLDLEDINVLEDQLIGVDSLYFMQLIRQSRKQQEKGDFSLTTGYVESIIDKIF